MGIGEVVGLGLQGAQAASGGKGGGGGGNQQQGVSPQEAALAQYKYQQGLVRAESEFAKTNTGLSTMATQAASGPRLQKALDLAKTGQTNADAQGAALQSLAQTQGQQAGQQAAAADQGFSGNQGGFGDQPNTTTSTG